MKYLNLFGLLQSLCVVLILNSLAPHIVQARIGESHDSLEGRLMRAGGIKYQEEGKLMEKMPYRPALALLSGAVDLRVYYKSADGRKPGLSKLKSHGGVPGWQLHVIYAGGKSVLEVYKRGQSISEFELNSLLTVHAQGSYWKKVEKRGELPPSFFGFDLVSADGKVRAKKLGGDGIMFFDAERDMQLKAMSTESMQQAAPQSVLGF